MADREKVISGLKAYINYPEPLCRIVKDALELLKKPDAYEVLDSISSAYYGKQLYFLQDNGMIYDRKECDYVPFEEAFNRFVKMVGED